jgi:hypothetical protein
LKKLRIDATNSIEQIFEEISYKEYLQLELEYCNTNIAVRKQRLPMKFDTLKTKNSDLHAKLSILISKHDKQDIK